MPKSAIADFVKAFGEDVLEEAPHELLSFELAGSLFVFLAILVEKGDTLFVHGQDATVVDGHAEDVARQVLQDSLHPLAPGGAVRHPLLLPGIGGKGKIGVFFLQAAHEFSPDQPGEGAQREEEFFAGWLPVAVVGDAAASDQTVEMRVVDEHLGPGVEYHENANHGPDVAGILGQFQDGIGTGLHEKSVKILLVGAEDLAKGLWHSDGEVEVGNWKHFLLSLVKPETGLFAVAFWATSVLAGVIGKNGCAASIALVEVATQGLGTAVDDIRDGLFMRWWHAVAMSLQIGRTKAAKDVSEFDHGRHPSPSPAITPSRMARRDARVGSVRWV